MEQWRRLRSWPRYAVSDYGRVMSKNGILKQQRVNGYPVVYLTDRMGFSTLVKVHRLVLEAFVSLCPDGMEAHHKDGDRANNRLENLEWRTHQENMAERDGGWNSRWTTDSEVYAIRYGRMSGKSLTELAEEHGLSVPGICMISTGRSRKDAEGPRVRGRVDQAISAYLPDVGVVLDLYV